jgi:hypothetical protein
MYTFLRDYFGHNVFKDLREGLKKFAYKWYF